MMKKLQIGLILLLVMMITVACGGSGTTSSSGSQSGGSNQTSGGNQAGQTGGEKDSSGGDSDVITITFWTQIQNTGPVVEAFNERNPDIEVVMTMHTTDGIKEALKVAAASNSLPDIWYNWGGSLGSFYPENGFTYDFTEYAKENNWESIYNPAALNLAQLGGQLSGVPFGLSGTGIIYKKEIFEKYGLSVPKTFDEFEQIMETLKQNGIVPLSMGGRYGWQTMRITEAILEKFAGPELHDALIAGEASWDHPAVVQTYEKLKEWVDKGYINEGFITLEPTEAKLLMYADQAAMIFETATIDGVLASDGQDPNDYGYFAFPSDHDPQRVSSFVRLHQVNANLSDEVRAAAIRFAEFFNTPEAWDEFGALLGGAPAILDATISPDAPNVAKFAEAVSEGSYTITDQALSQELIAKFFEAQDSVVTGGMTPTEAAAFMQASAEELAN